MARGRQQKWICLDCGAAFAVQGIAPKMCCACGSARLGRAPSLELAKISQRSGWSLSRSATS